jgi:uncharacterized protein (TIGR03437 family)
MGQNRKILVAKSAVILSVLPLLIYARSDGPEPRKTGAPGDSVCTECHVGTVNTGGGKVEVTFPSGLSYTPGVPQQWTVTVTDALAQRWGFQLSVRPASNESGGQAGDLTASGATTRVICQDGSLKGGQGCAAAAPLQFIQHTLQGHAGNTFTFTWTPPATDVGNIRVYVAGNGANGNGMESGDRIYTANYTLAPASGQPGGPSIRATDGVVNGASFQPGISAGSWITIRGSDFTTNTRLWRNDEIVDGRLPTQLDGVSVMVNHKPAAVYYISPTQLNVQAPEDDTVGPVDVEVTTTQGTATSRAELRTYTPAFFMFDPEDRKYIAGVHPDGTFLGKANLFQGVTTRPAAPGQVVLLFGTGCGPTTPSVPAGRVFAGAAPLAQGATARIGDMAAEVQFAGVSGAGLCQYNLKIPDALPSGDASVVVTVGGVSSPGNAFITISR